MRGGKRGEKHIKKMERFIYLRQDGEENTGEGLMNEKESSFVRSREKI